MRYSGLCGFYQEFLDTRDARCQQESYCNNGFPVVKLNSSLRHHDHVQRYEINTKVYIIKCALFWFNLHQVRSKSKDWKAK